MNYNDYPTEPIGDGSLYRQCKSCKVPVLEINGDLDKHRPWCEYRQEMKARQLKDELMEENLWLRFLLGQVFHSLPEQRDWLDPEIEKGMKAALESKPRPGS
jgi:hypothetical protein